MAIFQDNLDKLNFIGARDDGGGGDNWSCKTCKAPVKLSPLTNRHHHHQYFYAVQQVFDVLSVSPSLSVLSCPFECSNFVEKSVLSQNRANPSVFLLPNRVQYLPVFVYSPGNFLISNFIKPADYWQIAMATCRY